MTNKLKILTFVTALILIASLILPAGLGPQVVLAKSDPQLLEFSSTNPGQLVRVIVQKSNSGDKAEELVQRLGGDVLVDLSIINAFAANLEAGKAVQLSKSSEIRWVSLDALVERSGKPQPPKTSTTSSEQTASMPVNTFLETLDVPAVWEMGYDGSGIGVAVIDSGVATDRDFSTEPGKPHSRVVAGLSFSDDAFKIADESGHGTHVAGIIGGNGYASNGLYKGVAPKVDLINLKISDANGMSYESYAVAAMQWIYENKDLYNIRVVNISVNSSTQSTHHTSPMDAAAEILWFNGVVVVVSAGNSADSSINPVLAAPANDPFLITVGAMDERGTSQRTDDVVASYSASGITQDGIQKPELYAPGSNIVSVLSDSSSWDQMYPERTVLGGEYFRLSGTSMAAPMVTGAVALLLQAEPKLTPDQVKYRLIHSAEQTSQGPYLDVYHLLTSKTTESSNTGLTISQILWSASDLSTQDSVSWNSESLDSVSWNSESIDSVSWNSDSINSVSWNSVSWNSVSWNSVSWNSVSWNSVSWNSVSWNSTYWGD